MSEDKKEIKDYIESKILKYTFHAKNFTKEDMDKVDTYCKNGFGNDRKKMILTLITMVEDNVKIKLLNDKFELFATNVANEFDKVYKLVEEYKLTEKKSKPKKGWVGLKK